MPSVESSMPSVDALLDPALALDYWREQLDSAEILRLPTDKPRTEGGGGERRTHAFTLRLGKGGDAQDAPEEPNLAFFAAILGVLLFRYSEQEDMILGVKSRKWPHLLPLRVRLSPGDRFDDHLLAVTQTLSEAIAHRGPSLEDLSAALGFRTGANDPRLFQIAFGTDGAPPSREMDIAIRLSPGGDDWCGQVEYDTARFDGDQILRLCGHLETLAAAALADPGVAIQRMPLLREQEVVQIVSTWNQTGTDLPGALCLHVCFETQAARAPDAVAVLSGDQAVSYRRLNERANVIARALLQAGARRGEPVGICIRRGVDAIASILGVLKAGCAYVPMDPAYPRERLALILQDSGLRLLLTRESEQGLLPEDGGRVTLQVDDLLRAAGDDPVGNPAQDVDAEDLCYIFYTSGSTGQPKGILLRHGGVSNNIADLNQRFDVGPGDRMLAVSSLSFDMSVYEILGSLAAGAAIVLPDPERMGDPEHLATELERQGVTIWNSTPALLKMLLEALDDRVETRLHAIRLTLLGGDWIPVTLPDRLRAFAPRTRVIALGGATEASIHSTIYEVGAVDPTWKSIPYGRPMANQRVYVLDAEQQPAPIGTPGELYLGGIGLGRGYLNRPALTDERFLDDPFVPAGRMYRTGDRVRFLPDGNLELLGRLDLQVKVRGFRIELGEIEHAFKQAEPVEDAVVVVREDAPGDHRIVAYVIPRGPELDLAALKDGVSKVLPDYMVPSAIVVSSAFPLSPNGKIDRKALPPPEAESLKRPAFVGPSNALQHVMLDCWRAVLRIQKIGVHDNFFALGGDSVKCVQVVTRARQAGVSCTPNDLFKWPTVAQLSAELARAQVQGAGPPAAAREPDPGGKLEGDELSRIFAKIGR